MKKSAPAKKITKKSPSKAKVFGGSLRKRLTLKQTAFFSLAALLVLTTVGYSGFYKYTEYKLKAQAGNSWTKLGNLGGIDTYACKQYVPTVFGNLYKVTILNTTPWPRSSSTSVTLFSGLYYAQSTTAYTQWWGNVQAYSLSAGNNGANKIRVNGRVSGVSYTTVPYEVGWIKWCN